MKSLKEWSDKISEWLISFMYSPFFIIVPQRMAGIAIMVFLYLKKNLNFEEIVE